MLDTATEDTTTTVRDSFTTAVCKASLPPHYTLSVLKATPSTQLVSGSREQEGGKGREGEPSDYRHQPPGPRHAMNLQGTHAIPGTAHYNGDLLGPPRHMVLTTLQHLVWIPGLKTSAGQGGQLRVAKSSSETSAVLTTAVMVDLPVLANMLSNLFESSCHRSEASLTCLVDSLITIFRSPSTTGSRACSPWPSSSRRAS